MQWLMDSLFLWSSTESTKNEIFNIQRQRERVCHFGETQQFLNRSISSFLYFANLSTLCLLLLFGAPSTLKYRLISSLWTLFNVILFRIESVLETEGRFGTKSKYRSVDWQEDIEQLHWNSFLKTMKQSGCWVHVVAVKAASVRHSDRYPISFPFRFWLHSAFHNCSTVKFRQILSNPNITENGIVCPRDSDRNRWVFYRSIFVNGHRFIECALCIFDGAAERKRFVVLDQMDRITEWL